MFLERYEVKTSPDYTVFEFQSIGNKGTILKRIVYTKMDNFGIVYNLGFGDFNFDTNQIDDQIITDNGDKEKVLATVAATIYDFTFFNPDCLVYIEGSNNIRTRLYQIGITKYFNDIQNDFSVWGKFEKTWIPFEKNQNFSSFLIKRI
jgi:hypothetical protein